MPENIKQLYQQLKDAGVPKSFVNSNKRQKYQMLKDAGFSKEQGINIVKSLNKPEINIDKEYKLDDIEEALGFDAGIGGVTAIGAGIAALEDGEKANAIMKVDNTFHSPIEQNGGLVIFKRDVDTGIDKPFWVNKPGLSWQDGADIAVNLLGGGAIGFGAKTAVKAGAKAINKSKWLPKVKEVGTKALNTPVGKIASGTVKAGTYIPAKVGQGVAGLARATLPTRTIGKVAKTALKAGGATAGYDLAQQGASMGFGLRDDIDGSRLVGAGIGGAIFGTGAKGLSNLYKVYKGRGSTNKVIDNITNKNHIDPVFGEKLIDSVDGKNLDKRSLARLVNINKANILGSDQTPYDNVSFKILTENHFPKAAQKANKEINKKYDKGLFSSATNKQTLKEALKDIDIETLETFKKDALKYIKDNTKLSKKDREVLFGKEKFDSLIRKMQNLKNLDKDKVKDTAINDINKELKDFTNSYTMRISSTKGVNKDVQEYLRSGIVKKSDNTNEGIFIDQTTKKDIGVIPNKELKKNILNPENPHLNAETKKLLNPDKPTNPNKPLPKIDEKALDEARDIGAEALNKAGAIGLPYHKMDKNFKLTPTEARVVGGELTDSIAVKALSHIPLAGSLFRKLQSTYTDLLTGVDSFNKVKELDSLLGQFTRKYKQATGKKLTYNDYIDIFKEAIGNTATLPIGIQLLIQQFIAKTKEG